MRGEDDCDGSGGLDEDVGVDVDDNVDDLNLLLFLFFFVVVAPLPLLFVFLCFRLGLKSSECANVDEYIFLSFHLRSSISPQHNNNSNNNNSRIIIIFFFSTLSFPLVQDDGRLRHGLRGRVQDETAQVERSQDEVGLVVEGALQDFGGWVDRALLGRVPAQARRQGRQAQEEAEGRYACVPFEGRRDDPARVQEVEDVGVLFSSLREGRGRTKKKREEKKKNRDFFFRDLFFFPCHFF